MARKSRDIVNMEIAEIIAQRGTCERGHVGCVITKDGRIVATGYNSSPSNILHCEDVGCSIGADGGCTRTVHAEAGAISFAARKGIRLEGSTMYVTLQPCKECAKLIINSGVARVCFKDYYRSSDGINLLESAKVKVCVPVFKCGELMGFESKNKG